MAFLGGPPPGFPPQGFGPPSGYGPPPGFGPPPQPPPMFGPLPPQPTAYGSTRYHYHTRDGGPPSDGKPPSAPAGPQAIPPWGFAPAPPGAPFGAPPPPPAMACYATGPPPSSQPPPAYQCYPLNQAPPAAPPPYRHTGPILAPKPDDDGPAPGNRVNGRLAKVDDGSGVLMPEDMTTFHLINAGCHPVHHKVLRRNMQFKVQVADSHWTVRYLLKRLGSHRLTSRGDWREAEHLLAIQEFHEVGNGEWRAGSLIEYNDAKANSTLIEMGWGPDRGKAGQQPPVWVYIYPVNG